jgi:KipI family sensor histidine kinase inhibitor
MSLRHVHDYGDRALLLDLDGTAEVLAWCDAVREAGLDGVLDVVPAARTVLIALAEPHHQASARFRVDAMRHEVAAVAADRPAGDASAVISIDVRYDGEDLDEVARLTGLSPAEVIDAHTAGPLRVGFVGFAPGFAYLVDGDHRLQVPRRAEPRTRVPAGSVGLAGEFSGVYPRESPGGWQLIGHTEAVLWDVHRDPPALLTPGSWVRFRAVR